jgi:hypothetical protein
MIIYGLFNIGDAGGIDFENDSVRPIGTAAPNLLK